MMENMNRENHKQNYAPIHRANYNQNYTQNYKETQNQYNPRSHPQRNPRHYLKIKKTATKIVILFVTTASMAQMIAEKGGVVGRVVSGLLIGIFGLGFAYTILVIVLVLVVFSFFKGSVSVSGSTRPGNQAGHSRPRNQSGYSGYHKPISQGGYNRPANQSRPINQGGYKPINQNRPTNDYDRQTDYDNPTQYTSQPHQPHQPQQPQHPQIYTPSQKALQNSKNLNNLLASFGIDAQITETKVAPAVTIYKIKLGVGVTIAQVKQRANDIALRLGVDGVRIDNCPSGELVIEAANDTIETV